MNPPTRRAIAIVLLLAASAVPLASSAQAAPPDKEQWHEVFTDDVNVCGLDVVRSIDDRGSFLGKARGSDGLYYGGVRIHFSTSWTNPDNDKTITLKTNYIDKDLKVTDNGDGTLTVIGLATGGEIIFGPDGKLILRNPGQIRYQLLVSQNGTPNDPSDDYVIDDLGVIFGSTGLNESWEPDFCTAFNALLGP